MGTASVSGNGSYGPSVGFTPPSAGNYWWYASYGGDTKNNTAASACGASMAETVVTARPPNTAAPAPPAKAPPAACHSARSITLHVYLPRRERLRSATIALNGKRAKTLKHGRRRVTISLTGAAAGTYTVTIRATTTNGRHLSGRRVYHTCLNVPLAGHDSLVVRALTAGRPGQRA
ncbi:MAG TPA: hypothetical protein VHX88_10445 [Solirubrobacteraceae bacterium]|nr:hypothetical protein [Solirubrobacteraceae bacterium]